MYEAIDSLCKSGDAMFAISISIPPIAIAWAGLSLLIGVLALAKRRSFVGWMLASILLTPFVVVVLLYLPPAEKSGSVKNKPQVIPPPLPRSPSLALRAIRAFGFRVRESRAASTLSGAKDAAHGPQGFASRAELDRDIADSARSRFGRDRS